MYESNEIKPLLTWSLIKHCNKKALATADLQTRNCKIDYRLKHDQNYSNTNKWNTSTSTIVGNESYLTVGGSSQQEDGKKDEDSCVNFILAGDVRFSWSFVDRLVKYSIQLGDSSPLFVVVVVVVVDHIYMSDVRIRAGMLFCSK